MFAYKVQIQQAFLLFYDVTHSPELKSPVSPDIDCIWSQPEDKGVLLLTPSPGFVNQCSDAEAAKGTAAIGGKAELFAADVAAETFLADDEKANAAIVRAAEAASAGATKAAALAAGIVAKAKKQEQVKAVKAEVEEAEAAKFMSAQDLVANDKWFASLNDNEIEAVYAEKGTYSKGANGIGDTPSTFQASIRNLCVSFFIELNLEQNLFQRKKKVCNAAGTMMLPSRLVAFLEIIYFALVLSC
jgi:hypothetical protein